VHTLRIANCNSWLQSWTTAQRSRRFAVLLAAAALAVVGTGLPPVPASVEATTTAVAPPIAAASTASRVIIRATPGAAGALGARVKALGGQITRKLPLIEGFAAAVPAAAIARLRSDPALLSMAPDARVRVSAAGWTPTAATAGGAEQNSAYPQALRAPQVWQAGDQGQGVTVAVLDTGVTPTPDLAGRLVTVHNDRTGRDDPCENLSGEPDCTDTYGHGTFVAGIIAGDGASSGGAHVGVAPQARILAVKVTGADGSTDVSNVLAAIQWVVSFQARYHIQVLNLSMATDSVQTYRTDPFNYAVERAWDAGIVVVVSASNRGPATTTISKPGDDPLVITVGAIDDRGTAGIGDDEVPDFTSRGPTPADGLAKPDVVAPGAHMVSLRSPDSTIDQSVGDIDGAYQRGSGTSFSAAATSGVVALMLARTSGLTPNQVKYALLASARTLHASTDPMTVGNGEVDAAAAALNPPAGSANAGVLRSNGTGSLQASRGHVEVQTVGSMTVVNGLLTAQLLLWDPTGYLVGWNPMSWYVSTWELTPWLPVAWSANDWPGRNWGGRNWGGGDWEGSIWGGDRMSRVYGLPIEGSIWYGAWG
jgi:serine protease AprX